MTTDDTRTTPSFLAAFALAILATPSVGLAGIGDSPLPTFSDGKASRSIVKVPGVINRTGTSTVFFCTSLDSSPVDIGLEVFDGAGTLQNSVPAGVGALLNVAPGRTVTLSTSGTAAFLENAIVPVSASFDQGSARVVASSANVRCNAMISADGMTPPASLSTLGAGTSPLTGAVPSTIALPVFADSKAATTSILFPGAVKRGLLETAVFCTSTAPSAINVGVEVLAPDGSVANSIAAGNGAVLNVAPGQTVTFGTTGTTALLETSVIALPTIAQGVARVVSNSPNLLCSAASLDTSLAPAASMSDLHGHGSNDAPNTDTLPAALPAFSDGKPSVHIATVPGVLKRGTLQTLFLCSSTAATPVNVGVQVFALDGTLLNDLTAGVGAVLNLAPGATATIATSTTAAYSETTVIPLATGLQGVGRILASSASVTCTTVVADDAATPPATLATLGEAVKPSAGGLPGTLPLPTFSNGNPATHAAYFPGLVKRTDVETDIFCTSLASAPIDIGVQVLNPDGTLANNVGAGNGALLSVAPGATVSFGTTGTAALFETQVVVLPGVAQGMARVVSNSDELLCSGLVIDAALATPTSMTALRGFGASCGDSVLQSGEQCDGSSDAACPGNCSSECLCPAACGDGFVQPGEACDDGNATGGDCCSASCQLECDDGNICTQDSCNASNGACTNDPAPAPSCMTSAKSSFQLKKGTLDTSDKMKWMWTGGPQLSSANFGSPDSTTTYTLCIYDRSAGVASLATKLQVAPDPLWIDGGTKGWAYADKPGTSDGLTSIQLRPGRAGASRAQVRAAGANIPMPAAFSALEFFDQSPSITLQLRNDETGLCLGSTFTTSTANTPLQFKAKAP